MLSNSEELQAHKCSSECLKENLKICTELIVWGLGGQKDSKGSNPNSTKEIQKIWKDWPLGQTKDSKGFQGFKKAQQQSSYIPKVHITTKNGVSLPPNNHDPEESKS